ncbi:MAG: flagellar motor protein MotD [Betaproteobacteria bacterium]|nr:flagellar motor protein MotD [Betaproteobacteria bacterium]
MAAHPNWAGVGPGAQPGPAQGQARLDRRRRHLEEPENLDRWMVSYADFVTLLLACFIVMYAVSSVSEGKYRVVSQALGTAFRNAAPPQVTIPRPAPPPVPPPVPAIVEPAPPPPLPGDPSKSERLRGETRDRMRGMANDVLNALGSLVRDGQVRLTEGVQGIAIEINANVLFPPGEAKLEPQATEALRQVGVVLAQSSFHIIVEGHTDVTPIRNAVFASNWELSAVRASTVVRLFVDAGVAPHRLTAAGFGEFRPREDNGTAENRARNRRVAIMIEAPVADPPKELPLQPAPPAEHGNQPAEGALAAPVPVPAPAHSVPSPPAPAAGSAPRATP